MSSISKVIDDTIQEFINEVSEKYSINKIELLELWKSKRNEKSSLSSVSNTTDISKLNEMKKSDLISICKQRNLKCTGNKEELISYIVNNTQTKQALSKVKSVQHNEETKKTLVKKLVANVPVISIHKNHFGNFEHAETGFIFNNAQKVIGKQKSNGSIDDLNSDDINICNKYKFSYVLPSNLDKKLNLETVYVEELDEEEKSISKEDDEIEFEEEIELNDDDFEEEFETENETEYVDDE